MRFAAAALLLVLLGCSERINAKERTRLLMMRSAWIAATRAERCVRPALREPAGGDATAILARMNSRTSPEGACLSQFVAIANGKEQPDHLDACAPLFDSIERVAHASEACSPFTLDDVPDVDFTLWPMLGRAVRMQNAPLLARGELAAAARHVTDAMRLADDIGRKGTLIGLMFSAASGEGLARVLDELLVDPRLTADDARAIARDLDALLASGPTFEAMARQETAWVANHTNTFAPDEDPVPILVEAEQRQHDIGRSCGETLQLCAEHLTTVTVGGVAGFWPPYVRRLGAREFALTVVRMQAELRIASPADCNDPARRRAVLAPWLGPDRAILGDQLEPVVAPPAWQTGDPGPKRAAWVVKCVPAVL